AAVVEEAQLDLLGHLAEDRDVRAGAVVRRAERVRGAGPYLGHGGCSSCNGARGVSRAWTVPRNPSGRRSYGASGGGCPLRGRLNRDLRDAGGGTRPA